MIDIYLGIVQLIVCVMFDFLYTFWWQVGCYNACLILIKKKKSPDKKKPPVGVQLLSLINIVFLNKINRINYLNQEDYINKVFD